MVMLIGSGQAEDVFRPDKFRTTEELRYELIKAINKASERVLMKNYPSLMSSTSIFKEDPLIKAIIKAKGKDLRVEMIQEAKERQSSLADLFIEHDLPIFYKTSKKNYGEFPAGVKYVICDSVLYVFSQKDNEPRVVTNSSEIKEALIDFEFDLKIVKATKSDEDFYK